MAVQIVVCGRNWAGHSVRITEAPAGVGVGLAPLAGGLHRQLLHPFRHQLPELLQDLDPGSDHSLLFAYRSHPQKIGILHLSRASKPVTGNCL